MKLTPKTLLIVLLFTSTAGVCAQQPRLKGKVAFANPRERGVEIRINVKDRDTGGLVPGEQPRTQVEDWFHVAPLNALVDIEFDGGKCYRGNGHSRIRVKQENEDLQKVTLLKTRECKIAELRQAKRVYAGVRAEAGIKRHGGAQSIEEAVVGFETEGLKREAELMPSPDELRQELEEDAAHARNGEFFDTFQYKFALTSELYRDRPELLKVLTDFRANKNNAIFFREIGQVKPEMFTEVVRRELGEANDDANLDNVFAVVKEEALSANVRGGATVALLNGQLSDEKLKQEREYYRQQSPSSPIFANSLIALARIGEAEDRAKLYSYIMADSGGTRLKAMEALSLATLIAGPEAFPQGAETLTSVAADKNQDPFVRAFAYHSLRPFVDQGDPTAFKALVAGVKDSKPEVRVQVVLALGVGKTEQTDVAESLLRRVLLTDRSPQVREAARLSLKGASTSGWAVQMFSTQPPN